MSFQVADLFRPNYQETENRTAAHRPPLMVLSNQTRT
jgi:hypothetical protein